MAWRLVAVFFGSVILCFAIGSGFADAVSNADQGGTWGIAAGIGLGLILTSFVRDS